MKIVYGKNTDWVNYLPISINDTYGDPFIDAQIDNTLNKMHELKNHMGCVTIFTKAPYSENILAKLRSADKPRNLTVMYSLTGLDEGNISFDNRIKFIRALKGIFGLVVILVRPIIKGRNDDSTNLNRIVEVAAEAGGILVLGGLHDQYKMKKISSNIESELIELCQKHNLKSFYKSSCCAAYIHGVDCWMHNLGEPVNVDIVRHLGYAFDVEDGRIILDEATTGDLNFVRIITKSEPKCRHLLNNYNILSISDTDHKFECTSSWFCWATNTDQCIDCDYCIIKQIEYLKKNKVEIGCNPTVLLNKMVDNTGRDDLLGSLQFTKLSKDEEKPQEYKFVRATKECRKKIYI